MWRPLSAAWVTYCAPVGAVTVPLLPDVAWPGKSAGKSNLSSPPSTSHLRNINQRLTHWGRVTHVCVSKLTIIGSDNGLSPRWRQAIIWTNAGILLIRLLGTNISETSITIHIFSFKKMHLIMSPGKWWPFCLGLNVLNSIDVQYLTLISHGENHWSANHGW